MSACKHIAGNMRNLLMDDEVRYISGPLLQQLDRDLQECESESRSVSACCIVLASEHSVLRTLHCFLVMLQYNSLTIISQ